MLMSLDKFDLWYRTVKVEPGKEFTEQVLSSLNIKYIVSDTDLKHIPESGPVCIVANQPFGGIESLILASLVQKIRPDLKILANHFVSLVPELKDLFIFMNPFKSRRSLNPHTIPFNQASDWINQGGALALFPAGTVSHLYIRHRSITDPPWRQSFGRLIEALQVPVLPFYFSGANSKTFQTLGILHPFLRTLRLPAEVFNKQNRIFSVHIGTPIAVKQINAYETVREKLDYLRRRTYNLAHRELKPEEKAMLKHMEQEPVAEAKPKALLLEEYYTIPEDQILHDTENERVFFARARQIPGLLHEIGRQRERTFRQVQEGTGKALDLDNFDDYYIHLIAWDKTEDRLIGSYRLGLADEILNSSLPGQNLYTKTLFQLKTAFLKRISPAIELGRSFVAPEYQRSFNSLFLLWRGIGEFISYRPHYRYLFGPVSISNAYAHSSQMLMLRYLKLHHHNTRLARWVKPQNPSMNPHKVLNRHGRVIRQLRELEEMISDIEHQPTGIPVLIRQYIKLGAEFLAFNRDPLFSNVVDGLIVVDVHRTDRKVLNRYMGKEATKRYFENQGKTENK